MPTHQMVNIPTVKACSQTSSYYKISNWWCVSVQKFLGDRLYKNSSGDEIANVNFYAVRLEATQIR